jgi:hypothetical protein
MSIATRYTVKRAWYLINQTLFTHFWHLLSSSSILICQVRLGLRDRLSVPLHYRQYHR